MPPPAIASPSIVTLDEHVSMGLIEWWRWNPDGTFLQRSILHYGTAPARRASAEHATFGHGDAAVLRPFSPCPRPADLVIGRASEHFSADPQFAESGNNINTATDMFDSSWHQMPTTSQFQRWLCPGRPSIRSPGRSSCARTSPLGMAACSRGRGVLAEAREDHHQQPGPLFGRLAPSMYLIR
jgi:hypothetical protein